MPRPRLSDGRDPDPNKRFPVVTFRADPELRDALRATSTEAGESLGTYVRKAVAERMAREAPSPVEGRTPDQERPPDEGHDQE